MPFSSRDINASIAAMSSPTRPSPPLVIGNRRIAKCKSDSAVTDFEALYDSGGRIFFGLDNEDVIEV